MIVHLNTEQTKLARTKLLNDVVYIIFHDELKQLRKDGETNMSPTEMFLTARNFTQTVLELPDILEGLDDEIEDLQEEAEGENDAMIILMLASGIFQAIGIRRKDFESKLIILKIYEQYNDHRLFFPLLEAGMKKEQKRWIEGKKTDLLTYELQQIEEKEEGEDAVRELFELLITPGYNISIETIKENLLFINKYNIEKNHKYDDVIQSIYNALNNNNMPIMNDNNGIFAKRDINIALTAEQSKLLAEVLSSNNKQLK